MDYARKIGGCCLYVFVSKKLELKPKVQDEN